MRRRLSAIAAELGGLVPKAQRTITHDNGGEFARHKVVTAQIGLRASFCAPNPWQRGSVENANGRMRDELLNETLFHGLGHTRAMLAEWVEDYNTARPHSALGCQTPAAFAGYQTPAVVAGNLTTATDRHAALHEGFAQRPVAPPAPNDVSIERTLVQAG